MNENTPPRAPASRKVYGIGIVNDRDEVVFHMTGGCIEDFARLLASRPGPLPEMRVLAVEDDDGPGC